MEDQFEYLGRWVKKNHFRAFVYSADGSRMLANSYNDYKNLTESGVWFDTIELAKVKKPKPKPKPKPEAKVVEEPLDDGHS